METFGKLCFVGLAIITTSLLGGYTFMKLWQWFVVYAFGVQPINLVQAIGLVLFWGYLKHTNKSKYEFTLEKFTKQFVEALLWFGITLGLGYLITLFQ